ncbi:MAG TPA: DUF58 domain-containing protein [Thermoplasmata archaeon]|nr:DUF58 domain-containing protein [Thermoplasmata archaeon]
MARPPVLGWRAGTAAVLALGGAGVVVGFLFRNPASLLFATPLLLAPLAAYLLKPGPTAVARVMSSVNPVGDRLELRVDARLDPPGPGVARAQFDIRPPVRLPEARPFAWRAASGAPTAISQRITSDWPTVARLRPPRVEWSDPFGLSAREVPVEGNAVRFERPPAGARQLSTMMVQRLSRHVVGQRAPLPSTQGEFQSVRPFVAGDGVRQINWRATARGASLVSNSFLAEMPPDVVLALDLGPWALPPEDQEVLLGVSRAASHALAAQLTRLKTRLGAALLEPFPRWVGLGSGRVHLREIQELLASARVGSERPPVERYANALRRIYPPRTTVLLFSPFVEEALLSIGFHLRRCGLNSLVIAPSPLAVAQSHPGGDPTARQMGFRLLRLHRIREVGRAWQWGPAVNWEDLGSLGALAALFRRPVGPGGAGRG